MDPLTAALGLQKSINDLLTALINKASTTEIDAAIARHEARLDHIQKFIDWVSSKVFPGFTPPAT